MTTISEHLLGTHGGGYRKRVALQREVVKHLPSWLGNVAAKRIWAGSYRHLRQCNLDYSYLRKNEELSAMHLLGREVKTFTPLDTLIAPIVRPVSLVTLGPSAKDYDWDKLKERGRMIVAVSGGATFLRERGITPELLVVSDPEFSKAAGYHLDSAPGTPLAIEYRAAAALHKHFPETLLDRSVAAIERVNKWYGVPAFTTAELKLANESSGSPFMISEVRDGLGRIGWSDRIEFGFFPSSTVAFVALQILIARGAKDIEIIGMDLGGGNSLYSDTGPNRLAEQFERVICPSFQSMRTAIAGRGIKIKNISPACPLPPDIFQS